MKRFSLIIIALVFFGVPAFATPSIEFSPDAGNGFSGATSIPEPATIALLGFGALVS